MKLKTTLGGKSFSFRDIKDVMAKANEPKRTVVSNIHRKGTKPVEAGAAIAELCVKMLKDKASGLDLTR